MSVITNVEKRGWGGKFFLAGVTVAVVIGAITIIYPFLLMVSGSMRSPMDVAEMSVVPEYMYNNQELSKKFLEDKYNQNVRMMNKHRGYQDYNFAKATIPKKIVPQRVKDLKEFASQVQMPDYWWILGGTKVINETSAPNQGRFSEKVKQYYNGDLSKLRADQGIGVTKWYQVMKQMPQWTSPRYTYNPGKKYNKAYFDLLKTRPLAEKAFASIQGQFISEIVNPKYGTGSIKPYNTAHDTNYKSFKQLILPRRLPPKSKPVLRNEWSKFVGGMLNVAFIRTDVDNSKYQQFLKKRYKNNIDKLNESWSDHKDFTSFDQVNLPKDMQWMYPSEHHDFSLFLSDCPLSSLYLVGPVYKWQDWLKAKYKSLDRLNSAHQTNYTSWTKASIPLAEASYSYVLNHTTSLRYQFATSNFSNVFNRILFEGQALKVTIIYVFLSVVLAVILQSLAAYALSRFEPPGTWRLILIFMATMAFPPMVGMIPQYLILRKLHLFNTFIALILPELVNGYLIFLLKGFFDSLPKHLYEAALIDGASELRMFWQITMSLSKPILAVVALNTFNGAWMSFLYPLLVAPDKNMHVLAVWLYQFQQSAPSSAVFAAVLITSIPTLLIFIFTQRTIMRGIAVPAEK